MSRALDHFQGNNGAVISNGANPVTGAFWAIQTLSDTTFSAIGGNYTGTLTGVTIGSGQTIYGKFDGFTAGTGKVIAYKS